MPHFHQILWVILIIWAISDCVRRRENGFWIFVICVFPIIGALVYFAWTRNWLGQMARLASPRGMAAGSRGDTVADDSLAALQRNGADLVRGGRHRDAVKVLEQLLEREGPAVPAEARYDISIAYKELGRFRDARDQLRLIVARDPKFYRGVALLELADCLEQMKDDEAAREVYDQLLRMIRLPEARYRYGMLLDRVGETREAAEEMRRLVRDLDQSPDHHRKENQHFFNLANEFLKTHPIEPAALEAGE